MLPACGTRLLLAAHYRCKRDMQKKREIMHRQVSETLLTELPEDIHPVLRRVYASRGVGPAELTTSLSALIPVSQLENTDAAAERLAEARQNNERVLVVGDFDADGATATALMMTCSQFASLAQAAHGFVVYYLQYSIPK